MKTKRQYCKNTVLGIFFIFYILNLFGCAGPGTKVSDDRVRQSFIKLDRKQYIPLATVCSHYDLSWQWDGFSKVINVTSPKIKTRLYPGSALILYQDQVYDLNAPVRIHKGMIVVPESFMNLFFSRKEDLPVVAKRKANFSIRKIVIDAGHGGKDPGAVGKSGIREKDIVLDIALRLGRELKKYGITTVMTRDKDIFRSLKERSEIANQEKADFFISIHANAAETSSANGFEAYYLSTEYDDFSKAVQIRENAVIKFEENADYNQSKDLNTTLWDMILSENRIESIEMANSIADELKRVLKLKTRFVKGARFYVLKDACTPAVLLELGYLTNKTEAARLNNEYYQQMLAETVAAGIIRYKNLFELSDGFSR